MDLIFLIWYLLFPMVLPLKSNSSLALIVHFESNLTLQNSFSVHLLEIMGVTQGICQNFWPAKEWPVGSTTIISNNFIPYYMKYFYSRTLNVKHSHLSKSRVSFLNI